MIEPWISQFIILAQTHTKYLILLTGIVAILAKPKTTYDMLKDT